MVVKTVPIRVPLATRDRIRRRAEAQGLTYGAVIEHSLNAADREGFWDRIAALRPDDAYRSESEH